ncbi:MAG TPA: S41 family peptidase [Gammaproteobacteria bacterium]|mgnify:CR=1 FL=1|nr:S41 family peptidase [Gammaproteobacteria bacterium]
MQSRPEKMMTLLKASLIGSALILMPVTVSAEASSKEEKLPIADLQRFTKVIEYIKEYYVKPVSDEVLFENAMRGMLAGLDPHSSYFSMDEFSDLKASTSGKFGGLGVEVMPEEGFIRVISPIDDTPAQRAGIQSGDLIIKLDDTAVKGLTAQEAIEKMRGEKGSKIVLTILRQGENKPLVITVIRDTINVQSVRTKMLDDNFGYVRVSQFQSNSGDELTRSLQALKKNNGGKLKGIILDLRNNPGGVLDTAVQIADTFLDRDKLKQYDNVIVYAKGRIPGSQIKEKAHAGDLLNGAPMVVLVNRGSASAAEIVAGALQDYHRAVIVGDQTWGKGTVQTVLPLKDNRGLKLTTALYYTPAGRSIQATGIVPDILVQNLKIPAPEKNDLNALLFREADLQRHLENGNAKDDEKSIDQKIDQKTDPKIKVESKDKNKETNKDKEKLSEKTPSSKEPSATDLLYTDYQLHEALNILKGLILTNANPVKDQVKATEIS